MPQPSNNLPSPPLSLWLDTYGSYTPEPPLQGDLTVDVAIVGGGFTGLATAHELKRAEPSLRVAVLEAQTTGYGASGRNGSFGMTVVGLGFGTMAMLRGKQFVKDAHRYMMRAVDTLDELIQREGLDCDRIRPGFLRVATTGGYVKRIRHDVKLMNNLGFDDIYWLDANAVRARVDSQRYLGAMWEPRLVLINPAKLVREEKRLALKLGAQVYENTPSAALSRSRSTSRLRWESSPHPLAAGAIALRRRLRPPRLPASGRLGVRAGNTINVKRQTTNVKRQVSFVVSRFATTIWARLSATELRELASFGV
jgi:hypothetical protein